MFYMGSFFYIFTLSLIELENTKGVVWLISNMENSLMNTE